jgi:ribosomal protein S18 acetylase RimI-like enzyme
LRKCFLLNASNVRKETKTIKAATQLAPLTTLEIDIVEPEAQDVTRLCELLVQDFGYVYQALFGTGRDLTFKLMKQILSAHGGKHSLGYKSFHIARDRSTAQVVGMLLLKTNNSVKKFGRLIDALTIPTVVMTNLGVTGLLRTGRNWLIIHRLSPKLKTSQLHIAYLTVSKEARHRRVGRQLLQYARRVALEKGKQSMLLYVRQKNVSAQTFFLGHGFSVENIVRDAKADDSLRQGPSIRMSASVE